MTKHVASQNLHSGIVAVWTPWGYQPVARHAAKPVQPARRRQTAEQTRQKRREGRR